MTITKAAQDALEALDALLDVAMVPMTCEGLCSRESVEQFDRFSESRDTLRAALQDKAGEVPADFVPRLMTAVRIYQHQDYQAEEEASIADVAELHRAVCRIVGSAQPAPVVPDGFALVQTTITEEMHVAACKVLTRAPGLDGLPQRMLDAMLAASQQKGGSDAR